MNRRYFFIFVSIVLLLLLYPTNELEFYSTDITIGINDNYNFMDNIKVINNTNVSVDDSLIDYNNVGSYNVYYNTRNNQYKCNVDIIDNVVPEFDVNELTVPLGTSIVASDFVVELYDHSSVDIVFNESYSFDETGEIDVKIKVKDYYNNESIKNTKVNIVVDSKAPILVDTSTIYLEIGQSYNFDDVLVEDDYDHEPNIVVDKTRLDINTSGSYWISYLLEDSSGNKSTYGRTVIVGDYKEEEKVVYLTFDDGPSEVTESILNVLDKYGVKATFFVTNGDENYHHLIQKAFNQGHSIGLHTFSHNYQEIYSAPYLYFKDLELIDNLVFDLIGIHSKIIRFPGGSSNTVSVKYNEGIMSYLTTELIKLGYQYYDWNVSSGDATGGTVTSKDIVIDSINSNAKYINLLMHDSSNKQTTVDALPEIIEYYLSKGYEFKVIDEKAYVSHHNVNN